MSVIPQPGPWWASDGRWYPAANAPPVGTWVSVDGLTACGQCRRGVHSGVRWWDPAAGVMCRACQVREVPDVVPPVAPQSADQSSVEQRTATSSKQAPRIASTVDLSTVRRMRLTRDDTCVNCGSPTLAGAWAGWDPTAKAVVCEPCLDVGTAVDLGLAGFSAAMESWERREELRQAALSTWSSSSVYHRSGDSHARAFERGAQGEQRIGRYLDGISAQRAVVLHDRAASKNANIDHIVVAATGVWIVDSKNYRGRVRPATGRYFGAPSGLRVNGRDQSHLSTLSRWQTETVASAVDDPGIPVRLVLAFPNDAAFGWLRKRFMLDDIWVCPPGHLERLIFDGPASIGFDQLGAVAHRIGRRLPSKR